MTQATPGPITFWFDFGSPYAWLASTQVEETACRCGGAERWRAILLGVVFRTTGTRQLGEQRLRGDYARRDVARLARRMGLPFTTAAPPPGTSLALARVFHAIALRDEVLAARFAAEAFMATFARRETLDGLDAALSFAARLGPAAEATATDTLSSAACAALRAATQEGLAGGVFGAPFFVADGAPFWGQGRLPILEAWLREGPW